MGPNKWLESDEFLRKVNFYDEYYFRALTKHLANYIKNAPIPMVTAWLKDKNEILFSIGQEIHKGFVVDTTVSYKDYINQIEHWVRNYYPQYSVKVEKEIDYEDEEYLQIVKEEKISLDDALQRKKKVVVEEKGIIEKIFMREDSFLLNVNNSKTVRMSGQLGKELPLSKFLPKLRELKDPYLIKEFIFDNSVHVRNLSNKPKTEIIDYPGFMMKNFFIINFYTLKNAPLIQKEDRHWSWAHYDIKFDSNLLEHDCIEFAREKGVLFGKID